VYGDNPAAQAADWLRQGGEELHVVDLDGAFAGTPRHAEIIGEIIKAFGGPVEVGGGLRTPEALAAVLDAPLMNKIAKLASRFNGRDYDAMAEIVSSAVAVRLKKGGTEFSEWSALRLESMSGYKLPHGYATAIGICIDAAYAVEKGYLKSSDQETICGVLAECGALDGLSHSRHLLSQPDNVLLGLDAWRLSHGSEAIELPAGLGKLKVEEAPDREAMRGIIQAFLEESGKM
jgi:hypothetical protein